MGSLDGILPGDFQFLAQQNYAGMPNFLTQFMFQLCNSSELVAKEHMLAAVVATKFRYFQRDGLEVTKQLTAFNELQTQIFQSDFPNETKLCVLTQIYDASSVCAEIEKNWTGHRLPDVSEMMNNAQKLIKRGMFENALLILSESDPFQAKQSPAKQLLLQLALFLTTRFPSRHSVEFDTGKHRFRFLVFLVTGNTSKFLEDVISTTPYEFIRFRF